MGQPDQHERARAGAIEVSDRRDGSRSEYDLQRIAPDQPHDPADERFEEPGIVHHAEVDDGKSEEGRGRRDAADAVHRERADLSGKATGETGGDGDERQRDDDRGDAKQDQRQENKNGRDAE